MEPSDIVTRALAGERRWLARAITLIEHRTAGIGVALRRSGRARVRRWSGPGIPHVVGITGPPGAGKSTVVDRLVADGLARGERVAVLAVDPSSPFSGGAILGDRIRMERHTGNDRVFMRSVSSRGHLGGLSGATAEVVDLFDACGYGLILVETVGVGQSELSIMEVADTVVVVLTPESGDTVQTMKAGLLEIADVFMVNKADRPGAARLCRELERAVELDDAPWRPPVHAASALENTGISDVVGAVASHLSWCAEAGRSRWESRRGDSRLRLYLDLVAEKARRAALETLDPALAEQLRSNAVSPWEAAQ